MTAGRTNHPRFASGGEPQARPVVNVTPVLERCASNQDGDCIHFRFAV